MYGYSAFLYSVSILNTWVLCVSTSQYNTPPLLDKKILRVREPSYQSSKSFNAGSASDKPVSYGLPTNIHALSCRKINTPLKSTGYYLKPLKMIMQSKWVPILQDVLAKMKFQDEAAVVSDFKRHGLNLRKQVTIIFGDVKYTLSLLNWLVSALIVTNPPLKNIIVISTDEQLQELLDRKNILSVYVNPTTVTCGQVRQKVSQMWITRCAIYMLLNHWGYDVMAYDADAIVLKNLQGILDETPHSDVIGSSGVYPFDLGAKWGQTLCMGVVLFRSTKKTETLWNEISQTRRKSLLFDDQVYINSAFNNCNIQWMNSTDNEIVTGECIEKNLQGLRVSILPINIICRKCKTEDKDSLYVWHKQSKKLGEIKMKTAVLTDTWYLKNITLRLTKGTTAIIDSGEGDNLKGIHWIKAISKLEAK